ncbi:hypothetical protein [Glaciecola sp. 1036]|uniref:hypothetical protein n=1 Tax=Alteromonadaceae TaxID=72275 RepID=UPI003CFF83C1
MMMLDQKEIYMGVSYFIVFLLLFFVMNVLPWVLALISRKTSGNNKVIWFLMSFFLSWLGFIVYYFIVVKPEWKAKLERNKPKRILRNENGMPIKMYDKS